MFTVLCYIMVFCTIYIITLSNINCHIMHLHCCYVLIFLILFYPNLLFRTLSHPI